MVTCAFTLCRIQPIRAFVFVPSTWCFIVRIRYWNISLNRSIYVLVRRHYNQNARYSLLMNYAFIFNVRILCPLWLWCADNNYTALWWQHHTIPNTHWIVLWTYFHLTLGAWHRCTIHSTNCSWVYGWGRMCVVARPVGGIVSAQCVYGIVRRGPMQIQLGIQKPHDVTFCSWPWWRRTSSLFAVLSKTRQTNWRRQSNLSNVLRVLSITGIIPSTNAAFIQLCTLFINWLICIFVMMNGVFWNYWLYLDFQNKLSTEVYKFPNKYFCFCCVHRFSSIWRNEPFHASRKYLVFIRVLPVTRPTVLERG